MGELKCGVRGLQLPVWQALQARSAHAAPLPCSKSPALPASLPTQNAVCFYSYGAASRHFGAAAAAPGAEGAAGLALPYLQVFLAGGCWACAPCCYVPFGRASARRRARGCLCRLRSIEFTSRQRTALLPALPQPRAAQARPLLRLPLPSAGSFAGAVQTFISTPVELLKIRLQLQTAVPGVPGYRGPWAMLRHVLRREGPTGGRAGGRAGVLRALGSTVAMRQGEAAWG